MKRNKWISCEDEKPPYGMVVCCVTTRSEETVPLARFISASGNDYYDLHNRDWHSSLIVTHWQPMPKFTDDQR